ncbi:MAG: hypothetical protein LBM28_05595 [Oscillospiraceae bacterium]|jgi:uncharacterized FAD-dependent dehydrogenase|nr:hypothetical protein [Oscillospiraceae bacterium]
MIRISEILVPVQHAGSDLRFHAAQALGVKASDIDSLQVFRRSLDARKKPNLRWVYTVDVGLRSGEGVVLRRAKSKRIFRAGYDSYRIPKLQSAQRPVVVGFGPAGMFAALLLAMCGLRPIVLERGQAAPARREAVERFWNGGELDPESNVQFGEGGAGAFSDGKLTTGTKNERQRWILEELVRLGAQEEILYDAKPHIGTDVLFTVIQNLREKILRLGGEIHFGAKLTGIQTRGNSVCAATYTQNGEEKEHSCTQLILAIGHSARDTFRMLHAAGVPMEKKPFSMGVRIEHLQKDVDFSQYAMQRTGMLPPADYKLACHLPDGESAYTFCMCPGGQVVAASSQCGGVVTNGMSYAARDGENANSALLVTLKPEDVPYADVLGGVQWQEELEKRAFALGGGDYRAPAQRVEDFLAKRPSTKFGAIAPSYRPGVTLCDLHALLPEKISSTLARAIVEMDKKLAGFAAADALLTAPETRSSSPVRILRDEGKQSAVRGLYPCGEGAGYAGGILSAAVDGMLCAEAAAGIPCRSN